MVEPEIIEVVQKYLRKLGDTGLTVNFGVIFGSYADGCANELSDIDLLVVSDEFEITITGELEDGTSFFGSDIIRVIDPVKKEKK